MYYTIEEMLKDSLRWTVEEAENALQDVIADDLVDPDDLIEEGKELLFDCNMNMLLSEMGFNYIFNMDELDEIIGHKSPSELLKMLDRDFDIYDEYFTIDDLGHLCSADFMGQLNSEIDESVDSVSNILEAIENLTRKENN